MAESNPMSVGTNAGYNNCFTLDDKRNQENEHVLAKCEVVGKVHPISPEDTKAILENINNDEHLPYEPLQFGDLTILPQKGSERFLLPDKNNQSVTAYDVISLLAGDAFKSYRKQITPLNNKLQILPYSERLRAIFYFRKQYHTPPLLDNAQEIVRFIETALRYITNVQLSQNWRACLDAEEVYRAEHEGMAKNSAASLLAYYGWAPDFHKELPKTENVFYKVKIKDGVRHYEIVEDDIVSRFKAVEIEFFLSSYLFDILQSRKLSYKDKYNWLQSVLQPCLWIRNGIRMGLTGEAYLECNRRINDFINNILKYNISNDISLVKNIFQVRMDKSDPGFVWAAPRTFDVGL